MRAVICDDDEVLRTVISRLLEERGHEVIAETAYGTDAVELVTRFGAELLVLDLSLPGSTGAEVLRAISEARAEATTIVFTAFAHDELERRALLDAGAAAVVQKPDFEALEAAVADAEAARA